MNWLWKRLKHRVDALITERILLFHRVMIKRGQIKPIQPPLPTVENEK